MEPKREESTGTGVYDWWSRHPRALDALYAFAFLGREDELRSVALDALAPERGDRVLELGCGTGNSFAPVRRAVGATGTVVGLDASRGMVAAARDRVRRTGWQNVHAVRGDARRPPLRESSFDAVFASMSLSAVPEPERAVRTARSLLRPGGRLVVLDGQPFLERPWRLANAVVVPTSKRLTNWVPEVDLPAALRRSFVEVEVTTFNAGTVFVASARTET